MYIGYFLRSVLSQDSDDHALEGQSALLDLAENSGSTNLAFILSALGLVLFAGCMSGLTLGLMSLDIVELEVRHGQIC